MSRFRNPDEDEVQQYIRKAQAGQAGQNPRDQTLARSSNNVRAQKQGFRNMADRTQDNLNNQEDAARQQERAMKEQQAAQEAAMKEQAAMAEAQRKRGVREAAAAGVKVATDVETGKRDIVRHADGAPVWEAGPQGDPVIVGQSRTAIKDEATGQVTPVPDTSIMMGGGGDSGAISADGTDTRAVWKQPIINDRGEPSLIDPESKTDAKTGLVTYDKINPTTGQKETVRMGRDFAAQEKAHRAAVIDEAEKNLALEDAQTKGARMRFEPTRAPIAKELDEAQKQVAGLPAPLQLRGSAWVRISPETGKETMVTPAEVEFDKKRRTDAEARLKAAKEKYSPLEGQHNQLIEAEKLIDQRKQELAEERAALAAGLPQGFTHLAAAIAKQTGVVEAVDGDIAADEVKASLSPLPLADASAQTKRAFGALTDLGLTAKTFGDEVRLERGYDHVATMRKVGDDQALFLSGETKFSSNDWDAIKAQAVAPGSVPLYYRSSPTRSSIAEEAQWVNTVVDTLRVANADKENPLTQAQSLKLIADMGVTPDDIRAKVYSGQISVNTGEKILKQFYKQSLEPTDPQITRAQTEREYKARAEFLATLGTGTRAKMKTGVKPGVGETLTDGLNELGQWIAKGYPSTDQMEREYKEDRDWVMQRHGFEGAEAERIQKDTALEYAWTENDKDNIRRLSGGEIVINPGRIYGASKQQIINDIEASDASPAEKSTALRLLEVMREKMAEKLDMDLHFSDTWAQGMQGQSYQKFAEQRDVGDKVGTLDAWMEQGANRGGGGKFFDAALSGFQQGGVGIWGTVVGTAAGASAIVGSDALAGSLGDTANITSLAGQGLSEAAAKRGVTGAYGIAMDLSNTVTQMAPMFIGGGAAVGMKGIAQTVTRGAATAGWAFMQGYGSKLQDAINMRKQALGRELTPEEIAQNMGQRDTQAAAMLNGFQTAILTKILSGGAERIAMGTARNMTVGDLMTKTGRKALMNGSLKAELKLMGKNIFGDTLDESFEEGLNQLFDGLISVSVLNKDLKLGDLIKDTLYASAMGGFVGGVIPQMRFSGASKPMFGAGVSDVIEATKNQTIVDGYNANLPAGAAPLTPEAAGMARALLNPELSKKTAELQEQISNPPGNTPQEQLQNKAKALADLDEIANEEAQTVEAAAAIMEVTDPKERTLLTAIAKISSGNQGSMTASEVRAAQSAKTSDGKEMFVRSRDQSGAWSVKITPQGRAELASNHPAFAPLISESAYQPAPTNEQNNQGQPAGQAGAQASVPVQSVPAASSAQAKAPNVAFAGMDLAIYEAARAQDADMASVHAVVAAARAAGAPVSPSMAEYADNNPDPDAAPVSPPVADLAAMEHADFEAARLQNAAIPSAQEVVAAARAAGLPVSDTMAEQVPEVAETTPFRPDTTPEQLAAAEQIAQRIVERVSLLPGVKDRIRVNSDPNAIDYNGGLYVLDGIAYLSIPDIAVRLRDMSEVAVSREIFIMLMRHELMHIAQQDYVDSQRKPNESFSKAWTRIYGKDGMWGELQKNPLILKMLKEVYDEKSATKDGASAWNNITGDENKAAEGVRILLEIFTDPKRSKQKARVSELLRAQNNSNSEIAKFLKSVVDKLTEWVNAITGDAAFSAVLKDHLQGVSELYRELTAETTAPIGQENSQSAPQVAANQATPSPAAGTQSDITKATAPLKLADMAFVDNPSFDEATGKGSRESGKAQVVSMAGRQIVLVEIDGVNIPFYLSTGKAGKKNVAAGKWYPILGMDIDGWLNKGSEAEINNYYGSARLKDAALKLDKTLGTGSQAVNVSSKAIHEAVNKGLAGIGITPTANNEPLTRKRLEENQAKLLAFLGEALVDVQTANTGGPSLVLDGANSRIPNADGKVVDTGTEQEMRDVMAQIEAQQLAPLNVANAAINDTLAKFPKLAGKMRAELEGAVENVENAIADLPPAERVAAAQAAVMDVVNTIADRVAQDTGKDRMEVIEGFRQVAGKNGSHEESLIEPYLFADEPFDFPDGIKKTRINDRDEDGEKLSIDTVSTFVSLRQLIHSGMPDFPGGKESPLQPRKRDDGDAAHVNQIDDMVKNGSTIKGWHEKYTGTSDISNGRVLAFPKVENGKYVKNEFGEQMYVVPAGNGRTSAMMRMEKEGKFDLFEQGFKETADNEGIDTSGMQTPVPISIFLPVSAKQAIRLARGSNTTAQKAEAATAQTRINAAKIISNDLMSKWNTGVTGEITASSNLPFAAAFQKAINRNDIITVAVNSKGEKYETISSVGEKLISEAMLAMLFPRQQDAVLEILITQDKGLKTIKSGIAAEAGALIELGIRKPDYEITEALADALISAIRLKADKANDVARNAKEYSEIGDFFIEKSDTAISSLAQSLVEAKSQKAIRDILSNYRKLAEAVDTSTASMFDEAVTSRDDLILEALKSRPIEQVIGDVVDEFGPNTDLVKKLVIIAPGVKKMPADQRKAMNAAIGAEVERLRAGIINAPEYQRQNPDALTETEAFFQRFLDSHSEKTIRDAMAKLLAPKAQAVLKSSPSQPTQPVENDIDSPASLGLDLQPYERPSEPDESASDYDKARFRALAAFESTAKRADGASKTVLYFRVREGIQQGGVRRDDDGGMRGGLTSFVTAFEQAFGKTVIFFDNGVSKPGGLSPKGYPNYIAINVNSPISLTHLLGHELGHAIKRQDRNLYDAFQRDVLALAKGKESYGEMLTRRGYNEAQHADEIFNDIIGNLFARDSQMWRELATNDTMGAFAKIATMAAGVINKMLSGLRKLNQRDATALIEDELLAVRKNIADMLKLYRERGNMGRQIIPDEYATPGPSPLFLRGNALLSSPTRSDYASEPGPHKAGFEIRAKNIVEGFMSPDFKYLIGQDYKVPAGSRLIASDFVQYREGKYSTGRYRLLLVENERGERGVTIEKGIGNNGGFTGETLTFERMSNSDIDANSALSERSRKLWEAHPVNQGFLFSSPTRTNELDLFSGIESSITGPRAKQKANALDQMRKAPEKGKEILAKRVAKLEGLTDLDLFAAAAVKSLDAEPRSEADLFTTKFDDATKPEKVDNGKGLSDFGETLDVRKNRAINYSAEISETDITAQPLAKLWPRADVDAITDTPTAAIAHTLRESLPAKPRTEWKLLRWADKLRNARAMMQTVEDMGAEESLRQISRISPHLAAQARILITLPRAQWGRVESVTHYPDAYIYERTPDGDGRLGNKIPSPRAEAIVDGKRINTTTLTDLSEKLQALFAETPGTKAPAKALKFEVRFDRKAYYVMKKGDPLYRPLKDFETSDEAFAYIKGNPSALAAAWEAIKERENVKKTDVRNEENRPRVGNDWRNGKNATAEMFTDAFGFRGVAFGKWVEQGGNVKERQGLLNLAFDSLMDLSKILGVPTRAMSLDGTLGLAFGADGSGQASATYNEGSLLINLTKTRGAGTLAHEWFHAVDNYFQKKRPGKSNVPHGGNFITYQPETYYRHKSSGLRLSTTRYKEVIENPKNSNKPDEWERDTDPIRPVVSEKFTELVKVIDASPMSKRASAVDKGKADGYWSRIIEKAARSFENYVIHRMMQEGYHNDYLANVKAASDFVRDAGLYPYLLPEEIAPVAEAFDNLFGAMETQDTPRGVMLMSSPSFSSPHLADGFYSQLAQVIEQKMPNSATSAQVMQIAMQNAKAEEVKWSGLQQALTSMQDDKGKVTKAAVLEHLSNEGMVRFEEVVIGKSNRAELESQWADAADEAFAASRNDDVTNEELEAIESRRDNLRAQIDAMSSGGEQSPRYARYVLPGGENYREVVLAMPVKVIASEKSDNGWNVAGYNDTKGDYRSSHFPDVPNYVAHMRLNERDGGLFIEELQSDRHQAGRKKGYKNDDIANWRVVESQPGRFEIMGDSGEFAGWKDTRDAAENVAKMMREQNANQGTIDGKIADAPFRTTWPLALFKRALRDAVASGKTWIGWTTGETQNDRFDLSKQVKSIEWNPYERRGSSKMVTIEPNSGNAIELPITDGGIVIEDAGTQFDGKRLDEVVGKDMASKIMNESRGNLSGDGLKVGGSGMKGFYDNMLPKEIGKYVKQWGGKVEQSGLFIESIMGEENGWNAQGWGERAMTYYKAAGRNIDNAIARAENSPPSSSRDAAIAQLKDSQAKGRATPETPIWRIDITPAMREGVTRGQALFSSPTRSSIDDTVVTPPADSITTVEEFRDALMLPFTDAVIRAEQPKASYDDKRQLLFDFAASITDPAGDAPVKGSPGMLGDIPIIRQRLAQEIAVNLKVEFLGAVVEVPEDLAAKAQALRNPMFETFYVLAAKKTKKGVKILDAMAITSRSPGSANIFTDGKSWDEGIADHLEFLKNANADSYFLLHNHPSGDPSPSRADLALTKKHAENMAENGITLVDHIVINHKTFARINAYGEHEISSISKSAATSENWPSAMMEHEIDGPMNLVEAAIQHQEQRGDDKNILGFFTNPRLKINASFTSTIEELLKLTPEKVADYARTQGATSLFLHAIAKDEIAAGELLSKLKPLNAAQILRDVVVQYKAADGRMKHATGIDNLNYQSVGKFFGFEKSSTGTRVQEEPTSDQVQFAAFGVDSTKLGDARVGRMNALKAYRTLTKKRAALGSLSAKEEQQLLDAETALGQKMAFDMDAVKAPSMQDTPTGLFAPRFGSPESPAQQMEMSRAGEVDRSGQMALLSSPSRTGPVDLPDAIVAHGLGAATSRPEYEAAKAGDPAAALQLARALVTDDVVQSTRNLIGDKKPIVVPVLAIEQTGNNMIPLASANVLASKIKCEITEEITQSVKANRSKLSGLDRVFQRAAFDGEVISGADYLLVDDTLTQGGTFAALAEHIRSNGGNVIGVFALTGRQYSAKLSLSNELLGALREKFGDVEQDFVRATGYGFDYLTESEARALVSFRSADAVRNRIVTSGNEAGQRVDEKGAGDSLKSSPSSNALRVSPTPPAARISELMAKVPPIYRAVYADLQAGLSPQEVATKNNIPLQGVANIMRRLESNLGSVTLAAADVLTPVTRGDKILGGRPDLALSGNPMVAAVDQLREQAGVPEIRSQDSVNEAAAAMLAKDYQGTYDMLLNRARDGGQMTDLEVAATKMIISNETMSGRIEKAEDRMRIAMLIHGYREIGTETARSLAMRRDPHQSPAERHAQYIAEALFTPDQETRRRMRKNPKSAEAMLQGWMARVDSINQQLLSQGIDLKATLAAFNQDKIEQQEAERTNKQTADIINVEFKKLNRVEKAVIEAMRTGARVTKIELMTGVKADRIEEIIKSFHQSIRAAMTETAKNYLAAALRASPSRDVIDDILADLGIYKFEEIDDTKPGYVDRRNEKKKERRKRKTPRPKTLAPTTVPTPADPNAPASTPTPSPTPSPAPTPAPKPSKGIDERTGTWEDKGDFEGQGEFFDKPLDGQTGTWEEQRDFMGQTVVIRGDLDEMRGVIDLNDPLAIKAVMDAFALARGSKMDALMEFWRMSILTGPQTHVVNVGSNLLNAAYQMIPKRGAEAVINNLLGVVGLGSNEKATLGEFVPMMRNLKTGVALAARNALRSWKLETRTFEAYASATPIQLDFTGVGSEYIPPALGGKFGKVMRSLSFRAMTAADEFMKSLYGQMEAAAQAHRIATNEKLTGDAYAKRLNQLMVPGSEAWVRAVSEAKRITFQEDMDATNPRLIHRIDQLADLAKDARRMPYLGKPLTFFLPFIDTPTNIFKQAVLMSPMGTFISLVDGARALRRRVFAGDISKEEAKARASELYDRARFVEDVTNQTIGWMIFFAIESLVAGEDDDELPFITGTVPYKTTARGERDNAYAVMPAQTIRIGGMQFSYNRIEPFATVLASMVDYSQLIKQNGYSSKATSEWLSRFKDAAKDKTFLQGISNLFNAIEDPDRSAERLTASIITGFAPNLIRQPIREMDDKIRDTNPMADAGLWESVATRVGYGIIPQTAPVKMDVWGNEVKSNRGEITGVQPVDMAMRIFDPLNVQFNAPVDEIDKWIFKWNRQTADPKDRISIMAIDDTIQGTVPGEKRPRNFPLTPEERAEANRAAGQAARSMLGEGWDKTPLESVHSQRIIDVVKISQRFERDKLRQKKVTEAASLPPKK